MGLDFFDTAEFPPESVGPTKSSLLHSLKASNGDAWERFMDLYGPLVYYWCQRCGLASHDAPDVFQEAIKAVHGAIDGYKHDGRSFRGWLWMIVRNKARDHYRRLKRQDQAAGNTKVAILLAQVPEDMSEPTELGSESPEINSLLHRALDQVREKIEPRTWKAFWRVVVLGQATANVAAELAMTDSNVRNAKSRVLKRLRDALSETPI